MKKHYGNEKIVKDFHGNILHRDAYNDRDAYLMNNGKKIYCGWNIHHILPQALGGTDNENNLLCTNIITNDEAGDKITFWIDDTLYQVKKIRNTRNHKIVKLEK